MSSGVTLTASMRSNLLSLQNTQKLFDTTQERLSTGKKVNSALDNPTSYFTAQSLTKRADDLTGLLDTMGQAVQTLTAADESLTTLTTLTEQAQSLVNSALDTANTGSYLVGGSEISAYDDLTNIGGIANGDKLTIRTGDATEMESGIVLTGDQKPALTAAATFTLQDAEGNVIASSNIPTQAAGAAASLTVNEIMEKIESDLGYDSKGENRATVELVDGNITITSTDKNYSLLASGTGAAELGFDLGTTVTLAQGPLENSSTITVAAITDTQTVGFSYNGKSYVTDEMSATAIGDAPAAIAAAIAETIEAETGDKVEIAIGTGSSWNATTGAIGTAGTTFTIDSDVTFSMNAPAASGTAFAAGNTQTTGISVKSFMDQVNSQVEGVTASINDAGKLVITSDTGEDLIIQDTTKADNTTAATVAQDLGIKGVSTNGSDVRATYASQFNDIMTQINEIVGNDDTGYKGVNLLNGDDLTVNFNETRTSTLQIEGVVANTQGLGLTSVDNEWTESSDIEFSLRQVESALIEIEDMASTFAQNLSIVQTRQDFTENMVNVLTTGADDLTLADMNEEAANMLALQTRQQLATNALSLSSQSAQSVLSLF